MKRRSGFTLIELLVVVAIIAVLVSILLPALGKARGLAMQMSCAGRMKQVGLGMQLYLLEYKDTFPPFAYVGNVESSDQAAIYGAGKGRLYWADLLKPYVNDKNPYWGQDASPCSDVFFCPAMGPGFIFNGHNCSTAYMGFAYNNFGLGGDMWGNSVRLSKIQMPDKILCLAEAVERATWYDNSMWSLNRIDDGARIHYRHRTTNRQDFPGDGYCNVFYVDGHIKSAVRGEIKGGWDNFYLKYPYMEEGW